MRERRIALISMPCDSAGAALITLGAMIRDLGDSSANDTDGHRERLLRYARQFIYACRPCHLPFCNPTVKGCGYLSQATGKLRRVNSRGTVEVSEKTDFNRGILALNYPNHSYGKVEYPDPVTPWYIDGELPVDLTYSGEELNPLPYQDIVGASEIITENLRQAYSGLCLAGRSTGESSIRDISCSIRFRNETGEYGLNQLLSIHGWASGKVSRVSFFNTRTGQLDRNGITPELVIADGDVSFLGAIRRPHFQDSDIVGIVHRTMERERLEAVGTGFLQMNQWYAPDEDMLCSLPPVPRGISISILKRRT